MIFLGILFTIVISYLLGSINSSIIVCRIFKKKDIRDYGSHNAGLTNTLRVFGKKCAVFTLIGDLAKGIIAVIVSKYFCVAIGLAESFGSEEIFFIGYVAGIAAILGHIFPIYYHFRGGKGVLVGVSVFIIIDWKAFLAMIVIFAIVLAISKYVSLGSMIAAVFCPIITFVSQFFIYKMSTGYVILDTVLAACMAVIIIFMHRSNIERLKNGTENRFSFSNSGKSK